MYFNIKKKPIIKKIEFIFLEIGIKKLINSEKKDKIIKLKISCNEKDLILLPFSINIPYGVYKNVKTILKNKISNIWT